MSDITITCPGCNQLLEVPEDLLGQIVECPACNQSLQLPDPVPEASAASLKKKIVMQERKKPTRITSSLNKMIPSPSPRRAAPQEMHKDCPLCGEEILSVAVKCKHCGSDLSVGAGSGKPSTGGKKTDQSAAQGFAVLILVGIVIFIVSTVSDCGGPISSKSLSRPVPQPASVKAWYSGGTLHSATMADWHAAPYENRLATSADIVCKIYEMAGKSVPPVADIKPPAETLEREISAAYVKEADNMKVSEVVATLLVLIQQSL